MPKKGCKARRRWERRVLAGAAGSWSDAKARQLAHARDFLTSLSQRVEN